MITFRSKNRHMGIELNKSINYDVEVIKPEKKHHEECEKIIIPSIIIQRKDIFNNDVVLFIKNKELIFKDDTEKKNYLMNIESSEFHKSRTYGVEIYVIKNGNLYNYSNYTRKTRFKAFMKQIICCRFTK